MRPVHLAAYQKLAKYPPGSQPPGSATKRARAFKEARRAGYKVKDSLVYAHMSYPMGTATQILINDINALIAQKAKNTHEDAILRRVFEKTGRLTVLRENSNFEAIAAAMAADFDVAAHLQTVFIIYKEGDEDLLTQPSAAPYLKMCGYTIWDDELIAESDLFVCQHCEERGRISERANVFITIDTQEEWCDSCAVNHSFYCAVSSRRFDESTFELAETREGHDFCVEFCRARDMVRWDEEDNVFYLRSSSGQQLPGYHGGVRPWRRGEMEIPMKAIGVELEFGFKNGAEGLERFLNKNMRRGGRIRDMPFCIERDGSLGTVPGGCELISDPLPLDTGYTNEDSHWRRMLDMLVKAGAEGWKHRALAGIHVNMDVRHVQREDVFKFGAFISNCAALSKFIAGRKKIYGHALSADNYSMYTGGYTKKTAIDYGKITIDEALRLMKHRDGRTAPVHFRNEQCVEVRIFGSNIKYAGFMACVEYCVSALEYVQTIDTADVFNPILSSLYRHWLSERVSQYPYVCARIGITQHAAGESFKSKISPVLEAA